MNTGQAIKSEPKRRNHRQTVRSVREKVELGYPANLTQFCFGVEEIPRAAALEKLLAETIKNCRRLQRVPLEKLRPYARSMTEFPMLVSLRTSQTVLRRWLGPGGINLSADRGPAYRFNAHWPQRSVFRGSRGIRFQTLRRSACRNFTGCMETSSAAGYAPRVQRLSVLKSPSGKKTGLLDRVRKGSQQLRPVEGKSDQSTS
jgi:hypothetical protein